MRSLCVWWSARLVGELTQDREGRTRFRYDSSWLGDEMAPSISCSLPKRPERFSSRECLPFFGGLLPESRQREMVGRVLGVSAANDFALLDRLGGDVAGALQILPPEIAPEPESESESESDAHPGAYPDEEALARMIDELETRPLLAGMGELRLSLAGVQSKLPVVVDENGVGLPGRRQASTHILKPPIRAFLGTTENEALVMRLARAVCETDDTSQRVAPVEIRSAAGRGYLLVQRYDRVRDRSGIVRRLHQEDFCQALGVPSDLKYAAEGGPNLKRCFALVRGVATQPGVDVLRLIDAVIFNAIVGNADAHGKNFSLLYTDNATSLAPLYDLLSTVAYPELSPSFAMKIGGASTLETLGPAAWERFAREAEVGFPLVRRRVEEIAEKLLDRIDATRSEFDRTGVDREWIDSLAASLTERAKLCLRNARATG